MCGHREAILAHLPRDRVTEIVGWRGFPKRTDQTITAPDELRVELDEIRDAYVAYDDEEYGSVLRCVAAPVIGPGERVLGAISVSSPSSRLQDEYYRDQLPELVKNAANIIKLNIKRYCFIDIKRCCFIDIFEMREDGERFLGERDPWSPFI